MSLALLQLSNMSQDADGPLGRSASVSPKLQGAGAVVPAALSMNNSLGTNSGHSFVRPTPLPMPKDENNPLHPMHQQMVESPHHPGNAGGGGEVVDEKIKMASYLLLLQKFSPRTPTGSPRSPGTSQNGYPLGANSRRGPVFTFNGQGIALSPREQMAGVMGGAVPAAVRKVKSGSRSSTPKSAISSPRKRKAHKGQTKKGSRPLPKSPRKSGKKVLRRKRGPSSGSDEDSSKCNCKNSSCLKMYCECFAKQVFCQDCRCQNCFNTLATKRDRDAAMKAILKARPDAFEGKTVCSCRRSNCQKGYCKCYGAGVGCGPSCTCINCHNENGIAGSQSQSAKKVSVVGVKGVPVITSKKATARGVGRSVVGAGSSKLKALPTAVI